MGSIPKIVSTPLKWVSKKIIHKTILRFPGGDAHQPIACVYCPEMCRFSCPTAVTSGNDAVTPSNKMGLLYKEEKWPGQASQGNQLWPIYDCTGCGRCTEYCVYEMPVADRLFQAREKYSWSHADRIAKELTDETDPVGDLAEELGDTTSALRRKAQFLARFEKKSEINESSTNQSMIVQEPRSAYFLRKQGVDVKIGFEKLFESPLSDHALKLLSGKTWLFHESVWFTRNLNRGSEVQNWIQKARSQGVQLKRPFAQGHDCIDCGGEGIYWKLFPSQAIRMAQDIWERDQHRADGILCVSQRCAEHFRRSFGKDIRILSFAELMK